MPAELALRQDLSRLAQQGEVRQLVRGPRTVEQILTAAREAGDEQDRQEAMAADPLLWIRAHRPRRLIDRLLGR